MITVYYLKRPISIKTRIKLINYFWFGGFLESYKNGKKPIFHEGNEKKFLLELHKWLKCDIYNRKDTIEIFSTEMESWIK